VLSWPVNGFSHILDDDGPFSAPGNREIPGKGSPRDRRPNWIIEIAGEPIYMTNYVNFFGIWHGFFEAIWHLCRRISDQK
jgi:hypothetical protein